MKRLHLICNAHLDPVWQWTWNEGIASAIATFKSACDLADEYDYIFCHNESLLYEFVEENAPELFERIKNLVKIGKWHIIGGWYIQPDCNMPSGETFNRIIAEGKKYFKEKFGVEPTVAINFDSFGHSIGLPQILKKNGYTGYLICRPNRSQFEYPSQYFKWVSPDGSDVVVTQSGSYGSLLGKAIEKIKYDANGEQAKMLGQTGNSDSDGIVEDINYSLWGVGNHGGGPSRKDLEDIKNLKIDGYEIIHSTPENLFNDDIKVRSVVDKSLQVSMPGCYTSMHRIKEKFRKVESMYYQTEKLLSFAKLNGYTFDELDLKKAEKDLFLCTFHDILPGTVAEEGEKEALSALGRAERVFRNYQTNIFLKLACHEKTALPHMFPAFVFNYSQETITTPIEVELSLEDQNWDNEIYYVPRVYDEDSNLIESQLIKEESTLNLDWRKKIIFNAKLKPLTFTRFEIKMEGVPRKEKKKADEINVSEFLKDTILKSNEAVLELYDDTADPWGMSVKEQKEMGSNPICFNEMKEDEIIDFLRIDKKIPSNRLIENGDVTRITESLYSLSNTKCALSYKRYASHDYVDVKLTAEFLDKNKLLRIKFKIPEEFKGGDAFGDGPYVLEKKGNTEVVFQKFLGIKKNGKVFAIINDSVYGGKVDSEYIYITLLRGAGYCFHPIGNLELYPQDRYLPRIDSGRYTYNFRIIEDTVSNVLKEAELFNSKPYALNVFPVGKESHTFNSLNVEGNVILTTFKESTDDSYIIRLYNPNERKEKAKVSICGIDYTFEMNEMSIETLRFKSNEFELIRDRMPI